MGQISQYFSYVVGIIALFILLGFIFGYVGGKEYVCQNGAVVSNPAKCAGASSTSGTDFTQTPASCGKFGCEPGESSTNCCTDCGCPTGQVCENNTCKLLNPNMALSASQSTIYSVTIYLSNPSFDIGKITLTNNGNGNAKNIAITLSSKEGYFENKVINFDDLGISGSDTQTFSLKFTQKGLNLSSEKNVLSVKAIVTYTNPGNEKLTEEKSFDIIVYGKNHVIGPNSGWAANYPPWITPDQNAVREFAAKSTGGIAASSSDDKKEFAARWLFNSMRTYGVKYVNDREQVGDYVQFPIETLKRKAGDCEDQAILYASLLESIGIKSAVIVIPGHAFAAYYNSQGIVPVETTADDYDSAISIGASEYNDPANFGGMEIIVPQDGWVALPQVIHENEPDIPIMDIHKEVVSSCTIGFDINNPQKFWVAQATVKFQNNGQAPGLGCAGLITYKGGAFRDSAYECWTILAGETTEKTISSDIDVFEDYICQVFVE